MGSVTNATPVSRPHVIILNWNGAGDTIACLESLRASTVELRLVVIDNGSSDDSVRRISTSGLADEVLVTGENLGFAEGNNHGIRYALAAGAEVIVVLNNDTTVDPYAMERLVTTIGAGALTAVSPDIRYFDTPTDSWFRGGVIDRGWPRHHMPWEPPLETHGQLLVTPLLTGCCLAAGRAVWERIGLFDAGYFLLFEDSDWSLRATRQGVKMWVVHDSLIFHRVSRSMSSGPASLLSDYYFMRNGLRFEATYFPRYRVRFAWNWLVRATPRMCKSGNIIGLLFRILGAAAFAFGHGGRAPRRVEWLADRLTRPPSLARHGSG
jgi:GT2 family glycosyltransferase